MMTPKMKEDLCTQILNASRQLFLSSKISEVCQEKGTQKQLEFILELMNEELTPVSYTHHIEFLGYFYQYPYLV